MRNTLGAPTLTRADRNPTSSTFDHCTSRTKRHTRLKRRCLTKRCLRLAPVAACLTKRCLTKRVTRLCLTKRCLTKRKPGSCLTKRCLTKRCLARVVEA